jgi:hypothetical protein
MGIPDPIRHTVKIFSFLSQKRKEEIIKVRKFWEEYKKRICKNLKGER